MKATLKSYRNVWGLLIAFRLLKSHIQLKDHAKVLTDLPDEYLREIMPAVKKVVISTGAEAYNIMQVSVE